MSKKQMTDIEGVHLKAMLKALNYDRPTLAKELGTSVHSINRWISKGKIPTDMWDRIQTFIQDSAKRVVVPLTKGNLELYISQEIDEESGETFVYLDEKIISAINSLNRQNSDVLLAVINECDEQVKADLAKFLISHNNDQNLIAEMNQRGFELKFNKKSG